MYFGNTKADRRRQYRWEREIYFLHRQPDGKLAPINRHYSCMGADGRVWVDYNRLPSFALREPLTLKLAQWIQGDDFPTGIRRPSIWTPDKSTDPDAIVSGLYLYNDSCLPDKAKLRRAYDARVDRLRSLVACESDYYWAMTDHDPENFKPLRDTA